MFRTDRPTDRPTDRQTDRQTDIVTYRAAIAAEKKSQKTIGIEGSNNSSQCEIILQTNEWMPKTEYLLPRYSLKRNRRENLLQVKGASKI